MILVTDETMEGVAFDVKDHLLHIEITHFDSVRSVAFFSQVSQMSNKAYCHAAYVVPITT
jgi:hypothetical protein